MQRAYKYKIEPSRAQQQRFIDSLNLCRKLYNACLEQRKIAYRGHGISVTKYDQIKQLPYIKTEMPEYRLVYSQVLQNVVDRVDKAFQGFF